MTFDRSDRLQTLAWAAFGIALLGLLWLLSPILTPFLLAAILAYIGDPLVDRLEARRVPRTAGTGLVIVALGLLLVLLMLIVAPLVIRQGALLAERLPDALNLLHEHVAPWLAQQFGINLQLSGAGLREWVAEHWNDSQALATRLLESLRIGGMAVLGLVANLVLVPVVMFYLLRDWDGLVARIAHLVPRPWMPLATRMARDLDAVLGQFLRGQLSVMLLLAAYYSAGLAIAGVQFALPVGIITGLLVFIPYLGYGLGFTLALLVAILQFEGWTPIVGMLVVYGLGQVLESFVLTPYLVGERIGMHPLAVIFALLAFGQLFGFFGVLLALPAGAALVVGLRELRVAYLQSRLYQG